MTVIPMQSKNVSTTEDGFLLDLYERQTRWVVELNNGERVYQDDNRPGMDPPQAWLRLKNYCESNGLKITGMWIQFRTNIVELPKNALGYFFSKGVSGIAFSEDSTYETYNVGTLIGDRVHCITYRCPELIIERDRLRELDDRMVETCLIRNV